MKPSSPTAAPRKARLQVEALDSSRGESGGEKGYGGRRGEEAGKPGRDEKKRKKEKRVIDVNKYKGEGNEVKMYRVGVEREGERGRIRKRKKQ